MMKSRKKTPDSAEDFSSVDTHAKNRQNPTSRGKKSRPLFDQIYQLVYPRARELAELNQFSRLIHSLDLILSEGASYEETLGAILLKLISETQWSIAGFWRASSDTGQLQLYMMKSSSPEAHAEFLAKSQELVLQSGQGLPGRVLKSVQTAWITDLEKDGGFLRAAAAKNCGLISGLAVAIRTADQVLGVLELYSDSEALISPSIHQELDSIGLRIGQKLSNLLVADELRVEQDRLKQIMNAINANAMVISTDTGGIITAANEKFCEVTGYLGDEVIGTDFKAIRTGLESKALFEDLWKTIRSGQTWSGEIRNRKKSGEIYTVASVITPVFGVDRKIESYFSVQFDLTAQKQYQQQLLEAQEIAKIGSWKYEFKTGRQIWSSEHYRIFEIAENKAPAELYEIYRSRIHPEDLPTLDRLVARAETHGEDFVYDHRVVFDAGARLKFVQGIGKVTRDADGHPLYISGTCQDVTERVMRESEYRMTLDALGIGVWKYNPVTLDLYWDESLYRVYELDPANFSGHYHAWESTLTPEAKEKAVEDLRAALRGERDFNTTFEISTKSGKKKFIAGIGKVVRNQWGEPIMMYGLNWDRTKEFEAEARLSQQTALLQSVLDNIPNMVFVKNFKNQMRYTLLNRAGEKIFGSKETDVIGKNDFDFFPKDQADFFTGKDKEVFERRSVLEIPNELIDTPMGQRNLKTFKVPTYDENGKPHLLIGISTDITDDLKMQNDLEIERAKALHNAKLASLGEMSAGIAHEINNPLAIIDGNVRSLKRHRDDPEVVTTKLDSIARSVDRISRIVSGLKKFARQSAGTTRSLVPLWQILTEVKVLIEPKSHLNSVLVDFELGSPSEILCDSVEIEQVFINLINNAIDAVKKLDEKWVKVIAYDEAGEVVVRVIDSGTGIAPEIEAKLFQPFFTTKAVGEGTGLGLSIVKGIIDQHKAHIQINRSLQNTCFEVRFKSMSLVRQSA